MRKKQETIFDLTE